MKQLLCEVEDVFEITGRGCVVVPGVPHSFPTKVRVGEQLQIETPAGEVLTATLAGIEMINRGRPMQHSPFSLSKNVSKHQVPVGSKIYLLREPAAQQGVQADRP